jgi:hypothetical protein
LLRHRRGTAVERRNMRRRAMSEIILVFKYRLA